MMHHMAMTKVHALYLIQRHGPEEVLKDWKGTAAEATAKVKADPRKYFLFGDCENQTAEGECKGHEKLPKEVTHREEIIDGCGPEPVRQVRDPLVAPGCSPGKHCCAHGSGPFACCRCGAAFQPAVD